MKQLAQEWYWISTRLLCSAKKTLSLSLLLQWKDLSKILKNVIYHTNNAITLTSPWEFLYSGTLTTLCKYPSNSRYKNKKNTLWYTFLSTGWTYSYSGSKKYFTLLEFSVEVICLIHLLIYHIFSIRTTSHQRSAYLKQNAQQKVYSATQWRIWAQS